MKKAAILAVLAIAICACGGNSGTSSSSSTSAVPITAVGSTALLPLVKQAATDYQSKHPDAKISVSGGGSMTGLTQVEQKGADIGDSDVPAAGHPELVDHQVAVVSFAVVVNPQNGVKNLTTQQIRDLFSGKVKNWKDVGGADRPVTIVNRPRSSGTRVVLVTTLLGGKQPNESSLTQDSSGTVSTMVAQTAGAISYLGMAYVKPGEQVAVSIDGISPADANIESGKYKFWSYEHLFTNGQPSAQVADFINFVKNDTPLLRQLHFIPVSAVKMH